MCKKECDLYREKLCIIKKSIYTIGGPNEPVYVKMARVARNPWDAFIKFYTKWRFVGSKIYGLLMILMSFSSAKVNLHLILMLCMILKWIFCKMIQDLIYQINRLQITFCSLLSGVISREPVKSNIHQKRVLKVPGEASTWTYLLNYDWY